MEQNYSEQCTDARFSIIEAAKQLLFMQTNIEESPKEMEVLDSFLFRCWQMRWIDEGIITAYTDAKKRYEKFYGIPYVEH